MLRQAIGAPEGHGSGVDVFVDSMIYGGMNSLETPYTVQVFGLEFAPNEVIAFVDTLGTALNEAKAEHYGLDGVYVNVQVIKI